MASIDDRIVNMQFNNQQFEKGIAESTASLDKLNEGLNLKNAAEGIGNVQGAVDRFSMSSMQNAVSNISSKFSIFGAVAFSAIQKLTQGALVAGKDIAAALIEPLVQGGAKRALALQQANFQFRGLGLDIEATMAAALGAVKGTAFGLDDAATAAASFGATGITAGNGLESVLRSVAGVAAQTGSSYGQVANIFQTVAGNGRLMGDQLNQLSSYGVNSAAILAKALGTSEANVRDMVSKGLISFTMFSDAMNDAFGANAAKANETYTGALANMGAALARIGAAFAGPYFFAMRDIFNALGPAFDRIFSAMAPVVRMFEELIGLWSGSAVDAIDNLNFDNLMIVAQAVGDAMEDIFGIVKKLSTLFGLAFNDIFPPTSARQVASLADSLRNFTESLKFGTKEAGEIRSVFSGVLAVFSILGQLVSAVAGAFFDLIGVASPAGGTFLELAARVGDFIVRIDNFLKRTKSFKTFFDTIASVLAGPIAVVTTFFGIIGDGVKNFLLFDGDSVGNFVEDVKSRFSALSEVGAFFINVWNNVVKVARVVWEAIKPVVTKMAEGMNAIFDNMFDKLSGLNFDQVLQLFNTGSLALVALAFQGFFGNMRAALRGDGLGFITQFKIIFTQLRTNLKALEINTNVKTLTQIAIAVALLAASAVALSLVDSDKLAFALGAIGGMMGGLIGAFAAFAKLSGTFGLFQAVAISTALTGVAAAIFILSVAVAILAALPLAKLIQGTVALVAILSAVTGAMLLLAKVGPQALIAAAAIAIIAPAIVLLAGAIALLGVIPFANLIQGGVAFIVILGALVGALALLGLIGPKVLLGAIAIGVIAPAIVLLTGAIAALGAIPFENLLRGVIGFVVVLAALTGAMLLLGLTGASALLGAIAISSVALSMIPLVGAIAMLGALPLENLIAGVAAFTLALAVLVGAVLLLGFTGPVALIGAAAIVAIALAMAVLAPALVLMAGISWDGIGRLLTVLSAGLGILVVMGLLLIPASVGFLLLGIAVLLIGQGISLAATGIALLGLAIVGLVAVGTAGMTVITYAVQKFIDMLPAIGVGIGNALVSMAVTIGERAPELVEAFVNLLVAMLDAVGTVVPKIVETAVVIIMALIDGLVLLIPELIEAGLTILLALLNGINDNIEEVVTLALLIIANFIEGLANGIGPLLQAGTDLILAFINGIADTIRNNRSKFEAAALNIADALTGGLSTGLFRGVGKVIAAVKFLTDKIPAKIKEFLGIASPSKVAIALMEFFGDGMVKGLANKIGAVTSVTKDLGEAAVDGLKTSLEGAKDALGSDIDMSPTIRPVVDLSGVQSAASRISGILSSPTLSLDTSNSVARSVSLQEQDRNAALALDASERDGVGTGDVNYTQNNYSPKALSPVELYRNTKNQLSTLKGDLGVVNQNGNS